MTNTVFSCQLLLQLIAGILTEYLITNNKHLPPDPLGPYSPRINNSFSKIEANRMVTYWTESLLNCSNFSSLAVLA